MVSGLPRRCRAVAFTPSVVGPQCYLRTAMAEQYTCTCGELRKTLLASSVSEALTQFQGRLWHYPDRVKGAGTIVIRGPVRVRHATSECVFDRATGDLKSTRDLRPTKRR